jgi:hypothetical protein
MRIQEMIGETVVMIYEFRRILGGGGVETKTPSLQENSLRVKLQKKKLCSVLIYFACRDSCDASASRLS